LASLIYATKSAQIPFHWQAIALQYNYSENLALKCYFKLILSLKLPQIVSDPKNLIRAFCADLYIPDTIMIQAFQLVQLYTENCNISGLEPKGIAAASIYFACILQSFRRSQKEIAHLCNISELTLRSRLKTLQKIYRLKDMKMPNFSSLIDQN